MDASSTQDALSNARCVNGTRRGPNQQLYDFRKGDIRVEVKSAQFKWDTSIGRWVAQWKNVKTDEHDELQLVLYTPKTLFVFVHDGKWGLSTAGKATASGGKKVTIYGSRKEAVLETSLAAVLRSTLPPPHFVYHFATPTPDAAIEAILASTTGTA